jgi:spore photoproduct lyase
MLKFSHIYLEPQAENYPLTAEIRSKFPSATIVEVDDYRDIFNRSNQSWRRQKQSQKLILAVQKENFYYRGSSNCCSYNHNNFYYSSPVLNCPFDCSYCYLQGVFASAYLNCFVNQDDYFEAIEKLLRQKQQLLLCPSYDSDLLALDPIIPTVTKWIDFARVNPALTLELRTKSANTKTVSEIKPADNVILAWSLSPEYVVTRYEKGAAPLAARFRAVKEAVERGWKVRICFDPLLEFPNWQLRYYELIDQLFQSVDPTALSDFSVGVFRMNRHYFKKIKKMRPELDLLYREWQHKDDTVSYPDHTVALLKEEILRKLSSYVDPARIFS